MRNFLKTLVAFLFGSILISGIVFVWQKFWIFSSFNLTGQILTTTFAVICLLIILVITAEASLRERHKIIKSLNDDRVSILFQILYSLDNEKDIKILRRIRKRVNQRIASSDTNKKMIKATKDLCGKNCKCKEIKKLDGCETCKLYDSYVEYLLKVTDEN